MDKNNLLYGECAHGNNMASCDECKNPTMNNDKNKSAEEIQTHIIASYNGEWVKFEDHQKAITTLQQANAELQEWKNIAEQKWIEILEIRDKLEKQNAELVAGLKQLRNKASDLMDFCIDRGHLDGDNETEGEQEFSEAMRFANQLIQSNENRVV